jgi:Tol biopolymer transport system component
MMPAVVNLDSADQRMEASLDWFDSSSDGRFVAFVHTPPATEAYPNPKKNVYVRDQALRKTVLASRTGTNLPGNGDSYAPSISDDGLTVAFVSAATDLVSGDTNNAHDVFRTDSFGGFVQLMSGANGTIGDAGSGAPALSGDGTTVLFRSLASNLFPGDVRNTMDLIRVRAGYGEVDIHKVNSIAAPATSDPDRAPSVSKDGSMVAYTWPGQAGVEALYVFDANFVFSRPISSLGTQQAAPTSHFGISGDGKSVVVATAARLSSEDTDSGQQDVSVCDTTTAACRLLSQEFTLRPAGVPSVIESVSTDFDASLVSYVATFPGLVSTDPAKGPTVFVWTKMPPS